MKTIPAPWFLIVPFFLFGPLGAAAPIVVSVEVPDVDTASYGYKAIPVTIVYGKASPEDRAVDPATIDVGDLEVKFTAPPPAYAYLRNMPLEVREVVVTPQSETVQAVYAVSPYSPGWDPRYSGTHTITLKAHQVGNVPHPQTAAVDYAGERELTTFNATIEEVRAEVRGRIWTDTGVEPSLEDDGHSVDPGIKEWTIAVETLDEEFGFWRQVEDYYYDDYTDLTQYDGRFIIRYLRPGDYRLHVVDLPVEIAQQAVGDPARGGVQDGYYHFSVGLDDNGASFVVNLAYRAETNSPHAKYDDFEIGWKGVDVRLDVLANDAVDPPLSHQDLRIIGVSDHAGSEAEWGMKGLGSWGGTVRTDGRFIYYTPERPEFRGWEQFYYKISDGAGNIDLERAWVHVVYTPLNPFVASDDFVEISSRLRSYDIHVLVNDVIFPPHDFDVSYITVGATSAGGAKLTVIDGKTVRFHVRQGFTGEDSFDYTVHSSTSATRTAQVHVRVGSQRSQTDPYFGRDMALEALALSTPEGRRLLAFFHHYAAEMVRILAENDSSAPTSTRRLRDDGKFSVSEAYFPALSGDLSQFLLGAGESLVMSPTAVEEIKTVTELFDTVGSPELRRDLATEVAAVGGNLDVFHGMTLGNAARTIGIDPTMVRVQIYDPRLSPDVFSMKTPRITGHALRLWKNSDFSSEGWIEVDDAILSVEDPFWILTDPSPDPARTFYKVVAEADRAGR